MTTLPASASSLTKVLLGLSEDDIVHTWGGIQAGVGLTGSPEEIRIRGSWESRPVVSWPL